MHASDDQTPAGPATPGPATPGSAPAASGTPDPAPTSAPEASEAPVPAPSQPKSAYELPSKKNTVLRNMVWALALTMAVVVFIGIAFFGVGSSNERTALENSELDVAQSAERAQGVAPFQVAVPQVGEGWTERSARFTDGSSPRWQVEYTSSDNALVTLTEESAVSAPMLSAALPGTVIVEELEIEGVPCQRLSGGDEGAQELGLSCAGEDFGLLVHGASTQDELTQLMTAALVDIQG